MRGRGGGQQQQGNKQQRPKQREVQQDAKAVQENHEKAFTMNPKLRAINRDFTPPNSCRFFIIKSYSEDNIIMSIKHNVWSSTKNGNDKLHEAFKALQRGEEL